MTRSSLRRVRRFGRNRAGRFWLYVSGVVASLLAPLLIVIFGLVVHLQVDGGRRPTSDFALGPLTSAAWPWFGDAKVCLLALVAAGLATGIAEALALVVFARQVQRASLAAAAELKSAIHSQAFRLGASDLLGLRRIRSEELFTGKVDIVRQGLAAWWKAVPRSGIAVLLLLLLALAANPLLAVFVVLLAVSVALVYGWLRERARHVAREADDNAKRLHETILEDLRLSPLSAGYDLDRAQNKPFKDNLQHYERALFRGRASEATVGPLLFLMAVMAAALVAFVVGFSSENKTAPQSNLAPVAVVFASLAFAAFPAVRLYRLRKELAKTAAAADDILTYLDRRPGVAQQDGAQPLARLMRHVALDKVTLADNNGRKLLDNVSLSIEAGRRVGIVAADDDTPLALAGLFVRLYDPAAGRILFDDCDIRQATFDTLRFRATMVAPSGMLFAGSISDNVACGEERYGELQVQEAAKLACAYDFILRLPQGFSSVIGERQLQLDEGQAFRVALARAVVRDPSLLVIKEPNGQFDETASAEIDQAIANTSSGRTTVFLPSRITTLRTLDHIYLFHEGKLFAEGTHADLIKQCELYRHLHYVRHNPFRNQGKPTG